ncbi:glycoside hydrolase family 43 protein [Streptomyces azureus]|uniref:Glycoside hydrolase family 43 protein n=1 Tax=Streptomyces azureus TaxID=146537 RepID=A0A0K8PJC3_STRAJ|nr:glycoside hydrolase family 43 protein [Streptomyces azureus]
MIARTGPVQQCLARRVLPGPATLAVEIRTEAVVPPTVTSTGQDARRPGRRPDTLVFSLSRSARATRSPNAAAVTWPQRSSEVLRDG